VTWWRSKSRDRYDSVTYPDAAGWQLKIKQQALKHKKKRSKRRKKAARLVGKVHRKVTNCRRDFLHKQSRILVDTYDTLVFEDLSPSNLSRRPRAIQGEDGTYLPNGASARLGRSLQQTRS
jgi:putative transposase